MPPGSQPPAGGHSVTPQMIVSDVADLPAFLRARLDASGNAVAGRPAELRVGDPVVLLSDASERDAFPAGRDDRARVKGAACTS